MTRPPIVTSPMPPRPRPKRTAPAPLYVPPRVFRCDSCEARCELAPSEPLPVGWVTVGTGQRCGYRCGACIVRARVAAEGGVL